MVAGGRELIDTLWNVNINYEERLNALERINRYIMECKFNSGICDGFYAMKN